MGKITRAKEAIAEQELAGVKNAFASHNQQLKARLAQSGPSLLDELEPYRARFTRDPEGFTPRTKSKNRSRQLLELARHAFGRYPVCAALTSAWSREARGRTLAADFRLWHICAASGGSLYKELAKPHLTKKEAHLLLSCPHAISIEEALCYAVAKAAGANEGAALRLARSKISAQPFDEYWRLALRFFAQNSPETINQINDLADYLRYRQREGATLPIGGNTLASLLKRMDDWHRALQRAKALGDCQWPGRLQSDQSFERRSDRDEPETWTFRQITTSKELAAEGSQMRHCVFSYKRGCIAGELSIWSLSKTDALGVKTPKLTIELSAEGNVVQARGLANRQPRPEESHLLRLWSQQNGLSLSRLW